MNDGPSVDPSRLLAVDVPAVEFNAQQQTAYLYLLSRGASPAAACEKLALSLVTVAEFIEHDEKFCKLLARVNELLSQNVAAALYRSAMEGKVSAQTFYVRNWPPPIRSQTEIDPLSRQLNELTDDELIAQFRQEAPVLLAQLAATDAATFSSIPAADGSSGKLSESADTSGNK